MFSIRYKFPAWKDEEAKTVHFDGVGISVASVRAEVATQTQCDPVDLVFKDYASEVFFPDDDVIIPRNSLVIVNRLSSDKTRRTSLQTSTTRSRFRNHDHYLHQGTDYFSKDVAPPRTISTSETLDALVEQRRTMDASFASLPENMRCSISRSVLRNPHTVPCCGSNFCGECILPDNLFGAVRCPSCFKTVTGDRIEANLPLLEKVSMWKVESNFVEEAVTVVNWPFADSATSSTPAHVVKVERRRPPPKTTLVIKNADQ